MLLSRNQALPVPRRALGPNVIWHFRMKSSTSWQSELVGLGVSARHEQRLCHALFPGLGNVLKALHQQRESGAQAAPARGGTVHSLFAISASNSSFGLSPRKSKQGNNPRCCALAKGKGGRRERSRERERKKQMKNIKIKKEMNKGRDRECVHHVLQPQAEARTRHHTRDGGG